MPRLDRDAGEAVDPAALDAFFAPPPPPPPVIPDTPPGTHTFSPTMYPVRVAAAAQSLVAATISLLTVFNVWSPSDAQIAALMTVYAALLPLIGSIVGSKVTPVAKLEQGAGQ